MRLEKIFANMHQQVAGYCWLEFEAEKKEQNLRLISKVIWSKRQCKVAIMQVLK